MTKRKTQYEKGVDIGYTACANAVLNYLYSADKQHVQNIAESLSVTHKEMVKFEDELEFEEMINKNSSYWE